MTPERAGGYPGRPMTGAPIPRRQAERFERRGALVTGAASGIGLSIARALSAEGAAVTGVDIKHEPADGPPGWQFIQADVSDPATPGRAVEAAARDGLDYLVNAAGVAWFGVDTSILDTPERVWQQVLDINLIAPMRFARAAVPAMRSRGGGAMVHVASVAGLRGMDDPMDAYQVAKAGLISLSRALAVQLAPENIRSNTICPGAIETPMLAGIYEQDPSRRERMAAKTPIRRLGRPEDIAATCLHLLSDGAGFVTGTDAVVDGGWLAVMP
jgi:NAD(P)-dependent dehydrogenase (short-subunit alcohol dehydrogenase family)